MSKRADARVHIGILSVAALVAPVAPAQTTVPVPTSSTGTTAVAPASLPTNQTNPAPAQPAKRVWTNEDVSKLRGESPISTVGSSSAKPTAVATTAPKAKGPSYYHDQIAKLQRQIPPIDHQIAELQAALSGKTVDETRQYLGLKLDDWKAELSQLEKKRGDIESQIAALEDEARHEGLPTNTLH